jgi:hypothetical protein
LEIRLLEKIRKKIQRVMNLLFISIINHALKPLNKKLEETFCKEFNDLKTRALAYGKFQNRIEKNKEEVSLELEKRKHFLENELNQLKCKSPIKNLHLDDLNEKLS